MSAISGTRSLSEFALIEEYFNRDGADAGVDVGIGDDAAVLTVPDGMQLVAAVDTIVAGRHFPPTTSPRSIGHRALAVNLSDLAAMGAIPAWATLALTIPSADRAWLAEFADGLCSLASRHRVALVGGDTTRGELTVSVQIMGFVPRGEALLRSGACPGDLLVVTGTLGDAGGGLAIVTREQQAEGATRDQLVQRFDFPTPRVEFGLAARSIASAAMDLSDGLVGDLPKLAQASGLAAYVDVAALPVSRALRNMVGEQRARELALSAGDDYELLLAVAPQRHAELAAVAGLLELPLTVIGRLESGQDVTWSSNGDAYTPRRGGYDHFA